MQCACAQYGRYTDDAADSDCGHVVTWFGQTDRPTVAARERFVHTQARMLFGRWFAEAICTLFVRCPHSVRRYRSVPGLAGRFHIQWFYVAVTRTRERRVL